MHYNSIRFSDCWCNRTGDTTGYKFHSINCSNKNYEIYSNNISTYFRKLDPISYNTAWLRYKFYVNNYVCYMPILSYELNREKVTTSYFKEFVEITKSVTVSLHVLNINNDEEISYKQFYLPKDQCLLNDYWNELSLQFNLDRFKCYGSNKLPKFIFKEK